MTLLEEIEDRQRKIESIKKWIISSQEDADSGARWTLDGVADVILEYLESHSLDDIFKYIVVIKQ